MIYNLLLKFTAAFLVIVLVTTNSHAQLMNVKQIESKSYNSTDSLKDKVLEKIEDEEAQQQIAKLGISPEEAKTRVAALSESEIRSIANGEENQAGGAVVVVSLTTVLLVIIIILLID